MGSGAITGARVSGSIVVTGASGNVGTAVIEALRRADDVERLVAVARRLPQIPSEPTDKVEWRSFDIADDDMVSVLAGARALVHLAWRFHPTRRPVDTWATNVLGTIRTYEAAARAGVEAIVHASSVGTYSPRPDEEPDRPVDEGWPTHALPVAAYGLQKSYLERFLDSFEVRHPEVRVVRIRSAFVFQAMAAPEQRRIFAGPFVPGRLLGSRLLPAFPVPRGLRFQAVHADDLGAAYATAALTPVAGAFNVAADPVIGRRELADLLGARVVEVPRAVARAGLAGAFALRLAPAEPGLLELFLSLPVMDCSRARRELGWKPRSSSIAAVGAFLTGLREPAGGPTPPLAADAGGPARLGELATGVGAREGV